MKTSFQQVKEFHEVFGHPIKYTPMKELDAKTSKLRMELILEEFKEYVQACTDENSMRRKFILSSLNMASEYISYLEEEELNYDVVEAADALGDITYVVNGAALCGGISLDDVVTEIHRSNMSKLGEDGRPIYREDGKILKGPMYFKPDIAEVLRTRKIK